MGKISDKPKSIGKYNNLGEFLNSVYDYIESAKASLMTSAKAIGELEKLLKGSSAADLEETPMPYPDMKKQGRKKELITNAYDYAQIKYKGNYSIEEMRQKYRGENNNSFQGFERWYPKIIKKLYSTDKKQKLSLYDKFVKLRESGKDYGQVKKYF